MRFLQHISGTKILNLPYYLLKSLGKMAIRVSNHHDSSGNSSFHHGQVKLLIAQELEKMKDLGLIFYSGQVSKLSLRKGKREKENKTLP